MFFFFWFMPFPIKIWLVEIFTRAWPGSSLVYNKADFTAFEASVQLQIEVKQKMLGRSFTLGVKSVEKRQRGNLKIWLPLISNLPPVNITWQLVYNKKFNTYIFDYYISKGHWSMMINVASRLKKVHFLNPICGSPQVWWNGSSLRTQPFLNWSGLDLVCQSTFGRLWLKQILIQIDWEIFEL